MDKNKYKLDRTMLCATTADNADDHVSFWNDKTAIERLNAACFIINQIFGVTPKTKVDVSITAKRKHGNGRII